MEVVILNLGLFVLLQVVVNKMYVITIQMSVNEGRKSGGFWGLVEQKGPWKPTANDLARSHRPQPNKKTGGGIQIGGTKNAGHAGWYASINPQVEPSALPPPPRPSQYVQRSVMMTPLAMPKSARGSILRNAPVESVRPVPDSFQKPGNTYISHFYQSGVEAPRVKEESPVKFEKGIGTDTIYADDIAQQTDFTNVQEGGFQTDPPNLQNGGFQTESVNLKEGGFQTDRPNLKEGGFQTDAPNLKQTGFQTDTKPILESANQTDPIINDIEMEPPRDQSSSSSQTDPWIEDTVMTIETELVRYGYSPNSDLFQLIDSIPSMDIPDARNLLRDFVRGRLPNVPRTSSYDFEQAKREFEEFTTKRRGNRPTASEPRRESSSKNRPMFDFVNRPEIKTPSSSKDTKRRTTGMSPAQLFYEDKRKLEKLTKYKEKLEARNKPVPKTILDQIYQAEQDIKKHETKIRNMEKRKGKQKAKD